MAMLSFEKKYRVRGGTLVGGAAAFASYIGATRPAMKLGVPLVPLVILFGIGMLVIMWGGVLVSWWIALGVVVAILPALAWMRFVTAKDDQRCASTTAITGYGNRAAMRPPSTGEPAMLGMFESKSAHTRFGRDARVAARPRHWTQAKAENPLGSFVPFSSLVSPHDVITRGGDYLRVWRLDGVAFECADEHLIAERHEALCSLLRNLAGGQWAVWTHRLHRVVGDALPHPREPGFARDLSMAYQA
eukprot:gene40648-54962_t